MLLFHEVCHSSKIYLLIDGLKLENGILKEVGSNESDVFACLSTVSFPWITIIIYNMTRNPTENNFFIS